MAIKAAFQKEEKNYFVLRLTTNVSNILIWEHWNWRASHV